MNRYLLPILIGVALCGCNKKTSSDGGSLSQLPLINITLTGAVSNETDNDTKGSYLPNGDGTLYNYYWNKGDEVSLCVVDCEGNENQKFVVGGDSKVAIFSGQVTPWSDEKSLAVIAPYQSSGYTLNESSNGETSIIYNTSEQSITPSEDGDFGEGLLVTFVDGALAESEEVYSIPYLEFKQALASYQLKLSDIPVNEVVKEVGFECGKELFLSSAEINVASGEIVDGSSSNVMSSSISASVLGATTSSSELTLNFKLLPSNLSEEPLTLYVVTGEGDDAKRYTKEFEAGVHFERNSIVVNTEGSFSLVDDFMPPPTYVTVSDIISDTPTSDYWIITDETVDDSTWGSLQGVISGLSNRGLTLEFSELTTLGTGAFYGCNAIESVILHKVTTLEDAAFRLCAGLKSVQAECVVSVGTMVFYQCTDLAQISLPEARSIDSKAFESCSSLKSISMPKVTTILNGAFWTTLALESMEIATDESANLTQLGSDIFSLVDNSYYSCEDIELTIGAHNCDLVEGNTLSCSDGNSETNSYTFKNVIFTSEGGNVGVVESGNSIIW